MKPTWPLWLFAIVLTLAASYYQRATGPTQPQKISFTAEGEEYTLTCPRSLQTAITPEQARGDWTKPGYTSLLKIKIKNKNDGETLPPATSIRIHYRQARSAHDWAVADASINPDGKEAQVMLPSQPPAGKLAYFVELSGSDQDRSLILQKDEPIVIRFRNSVPAWALIPHILFMFAAMLLSTLCGLLALRKDFRWKKYAWLTFSSLLLGGFILGPIIQKFAFGAYWTGWPLGEDLTDTKTLIAAAFWLIALIFANKKPRYALAILAAIVLLAVFSIPHSTAGSEFNYQTQQVETER